MSPQEENAAILNSLWSMGETMFDRMLDQITKSVERTCESRSLAAGVGAQSLGHDVAHLALEGPTVEEREPCPDCFDTGEMVTRGYDGSNPDVEICPCRKVKQ